MSFKNRWYRRKALKAAKKAENRGAGASVLAIAWYTREQWLELTGVVPDRSELDDTYEQWEQSAMQTLEMLRSDGMAPIPIHLKIAELVAWCEEQGLQPDGEARARYASQLLRKIIAADG